MSHFSHLLSKYGVLSSFNIARKIKTKPLKSEIPNKDGENSAQDFLNKIKTLITLDESQKSLNDIPGLITPTNKSDMLTYFDSLKDNKKSSIVYASSMFSGYISAKDLNKTETLLAIQLIFNQLGISTDDLRDFNKKFNTSSNIDDEDDEENEDDDEF